MNFIRQCIRRPVAMLMAVLSVLVFGFVSITNTPITLLPDMNLPMLVVYTGYPNAGPSEVESLVTDPLEATLGSLSGVQSVDSISSEGASVIMLTYNFGTDLTEPTAQVRDRLELVGAMLPETTTSPMLLQMNMDETPISSLSITSSDITNIYNTVEAEVIPMLERIDGVASVDLSGGASYSIVVELDELAASRYGITMSQLTGTISGANISLPAGYLEQGSKSLFLRSESKITSDAEVAAIPITTPTGAVIRLGDIATVQELADETSSVSRINGQDCLSVSISKQQDANTLRVCREVSKVVEQVNGLGYDLNVEVVMDQGKMIEDAISNVLTSLLAGAALAILVLWFFLGDWKASAIIGISIPFSVILTFVMMYFADISINMVSLAGLVVGVGMIVDNSIVVLESMFQRRATGEEYQSAAEEGTRMVVSAVIASTLTSVVVYLPIIFMGGLSSELMSQAGFSIAFSLLASLISAITLVPCLFVRMEPREPDRPTLAARMMTRLKEAYAKGIRWVLAHSKQAVALSVAALILSLCTIPLIGSELMPTMDQGQFSINIETEEGLNLETLNSYLQKAEEVAASIPEVEKYSASASTGGGSLNLMSALGGGSSASVAVYLQEGHKIDTAEAARLAREALGDMPGCRITVTESSDMMGGLSSNNLSVYVQSDDDLVLEETVDGLKEALLEVEGIIAVSSDLTDGRPEARIVVDDLKAAAYGLTPTYVTSLVSQNVSGSTAANITREGEELAVKLRYPEGRYETLSDLMSMSIITPMGTSVPISEIAAVEMTTGPVSIMHSGGDKIATITAQLFDRDYGSVLADVDALITEWDIPAHSSIYTTQNAVASMSSEFNSLYMALGLAAFLVYMVMAVQFESLRLPMVIISAVPMAAIGALLGLFLTGINLSMISIIGLIVLVGLVVNNAIVLLDCVGQNRQNGKEMDAAIMDAGRSRLRPILMTTLTTIMGQLPLSLGIGTGGQLMQPMAIVIIGGLAVSTLLTLLVVPALYKNSEEKAARKREKKQQRKAEKEAARQAKAAAAEN
ncbi:MAG: efflux RND transporter permease subunit [Oscillospiraceae bacterium]|nr:efflux RND transporter permease subunit [Oscillospiraceae bacterium]